MPNFIDKVENIMKYSTYLFEAKTEKEREAYFENKVRRNSRNVGWLQNLYLHATFLHKNIKEWNKNVWKSPLTNRPQIVDVSFFLRF